MDPLVLGLAIFSAACFLAFALWPRSSPRGQLEVVHEADHAPRAASSGDAVAPKPEQTTTTTVVDNTPPVSDAAPLARLTDMLRLRRRRGRCD
jgi:hypothetical protein